MNKEDILKEVNDIFIDILDNEDISLNSGTIADDIEEWDSLTNIHLVVAIEKHFSIRFTTSEVQNWGTVGEMIDSISEKAS